MTGAIALYMRISNEDAGGGESNSIGNQRDLLRQFVRNRREFDGCTVMEFLDDGYTGMNFDRPGVQKMLSMAGNPIRCIIVKDFSRFGRNLVDVGDYLDQIFPFLGVRFIAVNENYDSQESIGSPVSLDVSLKAMIYEMYSRDISEKVRCVQREKMKKGEYLCAIAFYGYKRSETKKNRLEIDGPAAETVRRIFRMAAEGTKPTQIASVLNAEHIPAPLAYRRENHTDGMRGWKVAGDTAYWSRENVRRIISDERYTGCLVGRKRTKVDVSQKRTVKVPREDWIVAKDAHEAIVPRETYEQAQQVIKHNVRKKEPGKPSQRFRGLLKCAVCGRTLMRMRCKKPYFACPTRSVMPDSPYRRIHLEERLLEEALIASIQCQARLLLQTGKEEKRGDLLEEAEKKVQECQITLSRYKANQAAVFEDYAEGRISRQEYLSRKGEIAKQQEEMTAVYVEAGAKLAELRQAPDSSGYTDPGKYACASELSRELLVELVKEIRVSGEDSLEIVWNFREWNGRDAE